jgi:hypothetical protein
MEKFSMWEDAGGFYYRFLPEQCLEDFFREDREILTVELSQHHWWLNDPRKAGSEKFLTKEQAFERGNEICEDLERTVLEKIAADKGIVLKEWDLRVEEGLVFTNKFSGEEKVILADECVRL